MARVFTAGEGNATMLIPSAITDVLVGADGEGNATMLIQSAITEVLVGADGEGVHSWQGQCYDAYSECYYRNPGRG